jgi:hypothetical protein
MGSELRRSRKQLTMLPLQLLSLLECKYGVSSTGGPFEQVLRNGTSSIDRLVERELEVLGPFLGVVLKKLCVPLDPGRLVFTEKNFLHAEPETSGKEDETGSEKSFI